MYLLLQICFRFICQFECWLKEIEIATPAHFISLHLLSPFHCRSFIVGGAMAMFGGGFGLIAFPPSGWP